MKNIHSYSQFIRESQELQTLPSVDNSSNERGLKFHLDIIRYCL